MDTARTARFLPQSPGPSSHCRHHHHRRRLLLLWFRAPQVSEAWDHAHHELTARYDRLHREHQRLQDRLQETAHAVEVGHMQSAALEAQMAAADRESVARVRELEDEAGLLREEVEVSRAELGQALAEHALVQRAWEQERARLLNPGTSPPSPRGDEATEDWEAKCHWLRAEVQRLEEAGARARGSEAETQAARWREERAGPQELPRDFASGPGPACGEGEQAARWQQERAALQEELVRLQVERDGLFERALIYEGEKTQVCVDRRATHSPLIRVPLPLPLPRLPFAPSLRPGAPSPCLTWRIHTP